MNPIFKKIGAGLWLQEVSGAREELKTRYLRLSTNYDALAKIITGG